MEIDLDPKSETPLYRQLEDWFRSAFASGGLGPGQRLPSSRELARSLGVSRVTVDAAYGELIADGLVDTRGRAGSFVARPPAGESAALPRARPLRPEARAAVPALIDFSSGTGDDSLFPLAAFLRSLKARDPARLGSLLGPPDPRGEPELRQAIARSMSSRGCSAAPDEVLVTGGSQQALALCALAFSERGRTVLVESPSYDKALELFAAAGLEPRALPCDREGPLPEAIAREAGGGSAAFAYLMPNFRNPDAAAMGLSRRRDVVAAAAAVGLLIVEDDYVGALRYGGRAYPSLWTLAGSDGVVSTGTFSKLLSPGLRIGYLMARGGPLESLARFQSLAGMGASRIFQRGLVSFIGAGSYRSHIRRACRLYAARRDALADALAAQFPELRFELPLGGLFIWGRLDSVGRRFDDACADRGVRVFDGSRCYVAATDGAAGGTPPGPTNGGRFLRLNFARLHAQEMEEGARRLAGAYRDAAESSG